MQSGVYVPYRLCWAYFPYCLCWAYYYYGSLLMLPDEQREAR